MRQVLKGEVDNRMLVVCAQRIDALQFLLCLQVLVFKLCGMGCSEVSPARKIVHRQVLDSSI